MKALFLPKFARSLKREEGVGLSFGDEKGEGRGGKKEEEGFCWRGNLMVREEERGNLAAIVELVNAVFVGDGTKRFGYEVFLKLFHLNPHKRFGYECCGNDICSSKPMANA